MFYLMIDEFDKDCLLNIFYENIAEFGKKTVDLEKYDCLLNVDEC